MANKVLRLSRNEAEVLHMLLLSTGGDPITSSRRIADKLRARIVRNFKGLKERTCEGSVHFFDEIK